jgi:hypothetical protein
MSDAAFKQLESLSGLPNNTTSYPCSYDVLFSQEYSAKMGYKPVYLRNFEDEQETINSDFIATALYGALKEF